MSTGTVGILNVGAGDIKLSFDPNDPAECIRAARVVQDMLKRGFALLIETVQPDGTKLYRRAREFDPATCEYIIADLDPVAAERADREELEHEAKPAAEASVGTPAEKPKAGIKHRRVKASESRAVAVGRTAGG